MAPSIHWLDQNIDAFPHYQYALEEPNGLLAAGGDLNPQRILNAYSLGIFPWYNPGEPILWWSPNPRSVIYPAKFKPSRSLRKVINRQQLTLTFDSCFSEVIEKCSEPRADEGGTWIDSDMKAAYEKLHEMGYAHSVECWLDKELVGGLYGIALGGAFFGESMFSRCSNASKVAFAGLCRQLNIWGFSVIDCQVHNTHLESLGAVEISRDVFLAKLNTALTQSNPEGWCFDGFE
jgi:leucyl/phenylalanyl-tRNA--protein transferase